MRALVSVVLVASPAAALRGVVLPLVVHVAPGDAHEPAIGLDRLREQVEVANQVFAPTHMEFEIVEVAPLSVAHSDLETRVDRHRLAPYLRAGVINVFAVRAMRDVDDPTQWRRGVHWRPAGGGTHHFVVLTAIGPRTTLAHELGHYFGNRQHTNVAGNIMSYEHGPAPELDAAQRRRAVSTARQLLRSGELSTAGSIRRQLARRGVLPMWPRGRLARR